MSTTIYTPMPSHPAGTCLPLCEACTAILEGLRADREVRHPIEGEGPEGSVEVCGGEWVPMNASEQTCTRCGAMRAIPDDCVGEHEGCDERHRLHLEPYEGTLEEPRPSDVSSMGEGPEIEYDIPVLVQVRGASEAEAAQHLAADLESAGLVATSEYVESWHLPNHQQADGSDADVRVRVISVAEAEEIAEHEAEQRREAAQALLNAWEDLQRAYEQAEGVLPYGDRARFEAYLGQVFQHSSRMLGMQSIDEWMQELAAVLNGKEREND